MKIMYYLLLIICFFLNSCNGSNTVNKSRILEETRRYTEDYYFKKNYKVEILEFKLTSYKEISSKEIDSLIIRFTKNELLNIAIKLSGYTTEDFFAMDGDWRSFYITIAGQSPDLTNYSSNLRKSRGKQGYEAHVYSKYVTMDLDGSNTSNHLFEDRIFILDKDFRVLWVIK